MKKILFIALSAIILASCGHEAMETRHSGNPDGLQVELMFRLDSTYTPGVYRFDDGGYTRYFVISPYNASGSCWNIHQSGKTTFQEEIKTVNNGSH